jgi:Homeodomain-like domain-containing protein
MRGPKPTHRPTFPDEFLREAQSFHRQRKISFQLRQRAALVCLLHQEPQISHPEAAAALHMPIDWVRRWRRRWALGDFSLEDKPGRGCKPDFSPAGSSRRASHRL